jgi:hypothetical protein
MLVIAAGAIGTFLVDKNLRDKASTVVVAFTGKLRNALAGQSVEQAGRLLRRFNNQEAKFWLEDDRGNLLTGERYAEKSGKEWMPHLRTERRSGDMKLWQTDLQKPLFIAIAPCELVKAKRFFTPHSWRSPSRPWKRFSRPVLSACC